MKHKREWYIPKGAIAVYDKQSDAVAYLYNETRLIRGSTKAIVGGLGFVGKAQKPAWHFLFTSDERRAAHVKQFFESRQATVAFKAKMRKEQNEAPRGLNVGDLLRCMWGYEQTNVDYYEVTALIGEHMVEIRKIAATSYEDAWQQGESIPLPGKYIGEPMRKRARQGYVRLNSYSGASKMEPQNVAGVKVYKSTRWTAYH